VGCILNYVRLIITREIPCIIYIQLLPQLCTEVTQVTTQRTIKLKLTSDAQLIVDFSLPGYATNNSLSQNYAANNTESMRSGVHRT
jgi:hypothetical protein